MEIVHFHLYDHTKLLTSVRLTLLEYIDLNEYLCLNIMNSNIVILVSPLVSLSTIVLLSRDQQGMYGMQHFCASRNPPYNRL